MQNWWENTVETVWKLCGNCVETVWKLCGNCWGPLIHSIHAVTGRSLPPRAGLRRRRRARCATPVVARSCCSRARPPSLKSGPGRGSRKSLGIGHRQHRLRQRRRLPPTRSACACEAAWALLPWGTLDVTARLSSESSAHPNPRLRPP